MTSLINRYKWIAGVIVAFLVSILSQFIGQYIIRDFFIQCVMLALPEALFRLQYVENDYRIFLISFRTEKLNAINPEKGDDECDECRVILRNSLDMLAALAGLTLTLVIIALSASSGLQEIEESIFMLIGFSAFIIFGVNLALCYSITGVKMANEIILKSMKQYYDLTLSGIFCLALTLTWGLRSFSSYPIFTVDTSTGKLSLVFGFCLLFGLYWKTYVMERPRN